MNIEDMINNELPSLDFRVTNSTYRKYEKERESARKVMRDYAYRLEENGFHVSQLWGTGAFKVTYKDNLSQSEVFQMLSDALGDRIRSVSFSTKRSLIVRIARKHSWSDKYWEQA
jgi:hypothetical protein